LPELPEVQTIVNDLRKSIRGWSVADFYSLWEKNVAGDLKSFKKNIVGKKIKDVKRKGKYILIELDDGNFAVVHLRMTGCLITNRTKEKKTLGGEYFFQCSEKFIRHGWLLRKANREMRLLFSDVRKFGTIDYVKRAGIADHKGIRRLGIEPLSSRFDAKRLAAILKKHPQKEIRQLLLDQNIIAGIGNIYASEILFDAKIHPQIKCSAISGKETEKLVNSTKKTLSKAIRHRGTTISDYRDSQGNKGGFQNLLMVYNREHEQCLARGCRGTIQKAKLQGRSAFWCSSCQRLKNKEIKK